MNNAPEFDADTSARYAGRPLNIMVTGASGFIAGHVVERLLADGHRVTAVDLWRSDVMVAHARHPRLQFVKASVLDAEIVTELLRGHEVLIHAAAVLGTRETVLSIDVAHTASVNVVGGVNMLSAARRVGVRRVIVPTTPHVEWLNPYKITKHAVEQFCRLFYEAFKLDVVALQLGNVYGARERWLESPFGAPHNYQKIIPTALMQTLRGEAFFIYGDGEQKSDYIYIDDIVECFARAVYTQRNLGGQVIPIGRGASVSVNQVVATLADTWRRNVNVRYAPMRAGETHAEIHLDPAPLMAHLNYRPRCALPDGLAKTIPYYEAAHRRASHIVKPHGDD